MARGAWLRRRVIAADGYAPSMPPPPLPSVLPSPRALTSLILQMIGTSTTPASACSRRRCVSYFCTHFVCFPVCVYTFIDGLRQGLLPVKTSISTYILMSCVCVCEREREREREREQVDSEIKATKERASTASD